MKVLILISSLSGGGAEFVAGAWARYLAEKGAEVTVALTSPKATDPLLPGVRVHRGLGRGFARQLWGTRRLIAATEPDVVLALMPDWNLLAILGARLTPHRRRPAVVISGRNMVVPLRKVFGLEFAVKQFLARRLYRRADEFVAISHSVGAEAIAEYGLDPGRVSVVPNPALSKVTSSRRHATRSSERADALEIVMPGRLVAQKRPHVVIETAAWIQQNAERRVRVHFFGDGPLRAQLADLAAKTDVEAVFHGWVTDWYDACPPGSVAILASVSEGFGNVLVEAAAVGIPAIASSRCFGASDAILPGLTGDLIRGEEPADYASAVLTWADRGIVPVDGWLQRFSYENSGAEIESVLRSVTAGR